MKKVILLEKYQGKKKGEILKTDGETARQLIEEGIAVDPELKFEPDPEEKPETATAPFETREKAIKESPKRK